MASWFEVVRELKGIALAYPYYVPAEGEVENLVGHLVAFPYFQIKRACHQWLYESHPRNTFFPRLAEWLTILGELEKERPERYFAEEITWLIEEYHLRGKIDQDTWLELYEAMLRDEKYANAYRLYERYYTYTGERLVENLDFPAEIEIG